MGLFSKKVKIPEMHNVIWMNSLVKRSNSVKFVVEHPGAIILAWFPATKEIFDQLFNVEKGMNVEIKMANTISSIMVEGKTIIFLEHYPIYEKERDLILNWNVKQIFVLNALDEPLFRLFGSERIVGLMERLGMKEEDQIKHPMVDKSIMRAQQKLAQKKVVDHRVQSIEEWFKRSINPLDNL